MNLSMSSLLWGTLFSAIGLGYFIYGKKQAAAVPLACGVVLMAYPYFVASNLLLVLIGLVLSAIPWLLR